MRCRKCGKQIGNKIIKVNGNVLCEDCAAELGLGKVLDPFDVSPIEELTNLIMNSGTGLEFSNVNIKCPRCGMSLSDVEKKGKVGCIECYSAFNESILKRILKTQGNYEYRGRTPGSTADILPEIEITDNKPGETAAAAPAPAPAPAPKKAPAVDDALQKIRDGEMSGLDTDILKEALDRVVAEEDYVTAARIRDEINGREEGES